MESKPNPNQPDHWNKQCLNKQERRENLGAIKMSGNSHHLNKTCEWRKWVEKLMQMGRMVGMVVVGVGKKGIRKQKWWCGKMVVCKGRSGKPCRAWEHH